LILLLLLTAPVLAAPQKGYPAQQQSADSSGQNKDFEIGASTSAVLYYFYIQSNKNDEDQKLDYSGAKNKMKYDIAPVYMAEFQGYARWNFLTLLGDYKTDRVIKGGGSIEEDDEVASKLTRSKTVSEILQLGINVFDLKTSYRTVQFDFGRADVLDYSTNDKINSGQMKLNITDIDIQYTFTPFGDRVPFKVTPGYKYMDYSVPRIVYRFEDTTEGESDTWTYRGETTPQAVRTSSHMGGCLFDISTSSTDKKYQLICSMGMFLGPSRTKFEFEDSTKNPMLFTTLGSLKTGISAQLYDFGVRGNIRFVYDLSFINTSSAETNSKVNDKYSESTVKYVFGSTDYYNGFSLAMDFVY